jgi:excinuclease ABC subunit C
LSSPGPKNAAAEAEAPADSAAPAAPAVPEAGPAKPLRGVDAVKDALTRLPHSPGVYLMKNPAGKVLYVGKAKRLRARVASYARFEDFPTWRGHKIQSMVTQVGVVDYIVTRTEKEALILENTLIKKYRPRYNVDLRDDKNHLMLRLALERQYPRISLVRKPADDGASYFGPFDKAGAARKTLYLLQRIFPLRRCSDHTMRGRTRPCLDYETGRCAAPCTGKISQEAYQRLARQMAAFFKGKGEEVAKELERLMREASKAERYEAAALHRDRLIALRRTLERQQVAQAAETDLDVFGLVDDEKGCRLSLIKVRSGRVVNSKPHDLSQAAFDPAEVMSQVLLSTYDIAQPPPLILVSHMPGDPGLMVEILGERAGRRVEIRKPQRGDKKGLLDLALLNASRPLQSDGPDPAQVLENLAKKLHLPAPPRTMECVDISHLGGRLTVASVVSFVDGKPNKAGYRRYKVVGLDDQPDDYAAMAEVVGRRLSGDRPPPDLLVLDGGKGQLNVGVAVLEFLEPEQKPALASLAKGRGGEPDHVFLPGRKNPVNLKPRDPGLLMLMHLRDEAHRFAISYHRLLRKKALTKSILEEVPGVGPKKRRKMLKAFGSLAALKKAGPAQISQKAGVDQATAERAAAFLSSLDTLKAEK